MNQLLKNIFLLALIGMTGLFGTIQNVNGQTYSLHDSLRHILNYFYENAKDEKLMQAVKEAQALYKTNTINESLSGKLLDVDGLLVIATDPEGQGLGLNRKLSDNSFLIDDLQQNQPITISYAKTLMIILQQLPPQAEHPDYARSIIELGYLLWNRRNYDKALPYFLQALMIRKKILGEEHLDYANTLTSVAHLYRDMGEFDKDMPYFQQALAVRKKVLGEENPTYARSLHWLGLAYLERGEYDTAISLFQQSLAIFKKVRGEEHIDYIHTLNDVALIYHQTGEYAKALPLFQKVLSVRKKEIGEENLPYGRTLSHLAVLYHDMGEYDKARSYFQQTLAILKKVVGEEDPEYTYNLNRLAVLYNDMGEYNKALSYLQEALAIRKEVQGVEHPAYANGLNDRAVSYLHIGDYNKALLDIQQALAIRKKVLGEEHPDYAHTLNEAALLYHDIGNFNTATYYYKKALVIRKKVLGEEHPDYARSLNGLALAYNAEGNFDSAAALLMQASGITIKLLAKTYSTLSEQEKIIFLNKEAVRFSYLPSLLFTQKPITKSLAQQIYTNELTLKGMVLQDQQNVLRSIRKSNDSAILRLYKQWHFNKTFLGKQLLLPINQRISYFDSLQQVTDELEQHLSRQSVAFGQQLRSPVITVKDISQKLLKDQAAIEFIRFPLYNRKWTDSILYAAMILLPGDSVVHFIPLCEEKQLLRLLGSSAVSASDDVVIEHLYGDERGAGTLSDSLYQLIWKPLEKYFESTHTVYYAPAGLLHRIAFQALRTDATHFLINKYRLNQVLSTRSIALPALITSKPISASIWGNIDYAMNNTIASRQLTRGQNTIDTTASSFNFYNSDTRGYRGEGWDPLPGAKSEMDSLKRTFQHSGINITAFSGTLATEEAFKALDGKSPQVLHLATHGFFLPVAQNKPKSSYDLSAGDAFKVQRNPMFRSGLILAGGNYAWKGEPATPGVEDGILTAYEIAHMDLSNTDLVVLSACETALGDLQGNEGVIGLQRAFKMAGVKQMILSLWSVYDEISKELMALFYQNWLSGQSTHEALRNAQLKIKEKYPEPYYWAAFVVVE